MELLSQDRRLSGRAWWLVLTASCVLAVTLVAGFVLLRPHGEVLSNIPSGYGVGSTRLHEEGQPYALGLSRLENQGSDPIELVSVTLESSQDHAQPSPAVETRVSDRFRGHTHGAFLTGWWPNEDYDQTNTTPLAGTTVAPGYRVNILLIVDAQEPGCYKWDRQIITYRTTGLLPRTHTAVATVDVEIGSPNAPGCTPGQ